MIQTPCAIQTDCPPENTLDRIQFNTSLIELEHSKEKKDTHASNLKNLNLEIKTIEHQLDSGLFQKPFTHNQGKHLNKVHNKLEQLKVKLQATYTENHPADLEKDLLNPYKPPKEFF